jgi:hypothetical protein
MYKMTSMSLGIVRKIGAEVMLHWRCSQGRYVVRFFALVVSHSLFAVLDRCNSIVETTRQCRR